MRLCEAKDPICTHVNTVCALHSVRIQCTEVQADCAGRLADGSGSGSGIVTNKGLVVCSDTDLGSRLASSAGSSAHNA